MHERRVPSKDGLTAVPSWGLNGQGWWAARKYSESRTSKPPFHSFPQTYTHTQTDYTENPGFKILFKPGNQVLGF